MGEMASYSSLVSNNVGDKKIEKMEISIVADCFNGEFNATDLQLQEGIHKTLYNPNTKEFLKDVDFGVNERAFIDTVGKPVKLGVQPRVLSGLKNRIYNIMGRGHEVISLPNVFHEDYRYELVSTAVDLTLYPKADYDLLKISTNQGSLINGRAYSEEENHPLNYKYTREFYFPAGIKGSKIELNTSELKARVNGVDIPANRGEIVNGLTLDVVQRFMILPFGSTRLRVEFYKKVLDSEGKYIYRDIGIGFNGVAEFRQYEKGVKY